MRRPPGQHQAQAGQARELDGVVLRERVVRPRHQVGARHRQQLLVRAGGLLVAEQDGHVHAAHVQQRAGTDVVRAEQYLDFLRGRRFRESLLVKKSRAACIALS